MGGSQDPGWMGALTETETAERGVGLGRRRNTEFGFESGRFHVPMRNLSGCNQYAVVYVHGI